MLGLFNLLLQFCIEHTMLLVTVYNYLLLYIRFFSIKQTENMSGLYSGFQLCFNVYG